MIRRDLILHAVCSAGIYIVAQLLLPAGWAVILALAAGIAKELWDQFRPGGSGFDWADIAADIAGIGAAALILYILNP